MSYTTTAAARRSEVHRRRAPRSEWAEAGMLVVFLAITAGVATLGTVTTIDQVDGWYSRVPHVTWTPPNWAFGAVWTALYTMIAVSGWLLWRARHRASVRWPLALFVAQLVLNAVWTPVFFGAFPLIGPPALWIAVAIILLLDLLVAATIAAAWPISRPAAVLLLPYFAWILYASTLNWGDAILISLV